MINTGLDFIHHFVLAISTLVAGLPLALKVAVISFALALTLTLHIIDNAKKGH